MSLLQELNHPNIVKLHKVLESPDTCHLFMEHCTGGELLGLMDHMEFDDDGGRQLQFDDLHDGEAVEFAEHHAHILKSQRPNIFSTRRRGRDDF